MKSTVAIGRLCVSGWHRQEVGNFLVDAAVSSLTDPELNKRIDDILHIPISATPTLCARNKLVHTCLENDVDILFMADDDAAPPAGWFKAAYMFLVKHPGPAVIAAPYCCGGLQEKVQVFEMASPRNDPQLTFKLEHISREDAARRTGIEKVANVGTHCIAYRMDCFEVFEDAYNNSVWFDYTYDDMYTKVVETEDCYFHRHLYMAGVPLYVNWDMWCPHYKEHAINKPYVIEKKDIERIYVSQYLAEALTEESQDRTQEEPK